MTDAPERIWVTAREYISPAFRSFKATDLDHRNDDGSCDYPEYHLARPGQQCSTDEFLRRLMDSQLYADEWRVAAIEKWLSGDFTAAMEGLE